MSKRLSMRILNTGTQDYTVSHFEITRKNSVYESFNLRENLVLLLVKEREIHWGIYYKIFR